MQIRGRRLLGFSFLLRNEENRLVCVDGRVDCRKRCGPPDEKRNYDVRKDYDVAKRKDWNSVRRF
jgi:hypothetical protein